MNPLRRRLASLGPATDRMLAAWAAALLFAMASGCAGPAHRAESFPTSSASTAKGAGDLPASETIAVTAHPLATDAALTMLARGGSAIDAAIAAQMVLGLVEPQSSGIGGGTLLMHWEAAAGRLVALDGLSAAPSKVSSGLRVDADGKQLPATVSRSGRAVGVPGTLPVLDLAHQRYGRLAWAELFAPAISLAERGFALPPYLHSILSQPGAAAAHPAFADLYFDKEGQVLPIGSLVRNLAYARTMRAIARQRARGWLEHEGAAAIVQATRIGPYSGWISEQDLLAYRPREREPICAPFQSTRVCAFPPPSFGGIYLLQVLGMLQAMAPTRYDLDDPGFAHLYLEAGRLAQADRLRWAGDPDQVPVPLAGLLDPHYLALRARAINPAVAMSKPAAGEPPGALPSFASQEHDPVSTTSQLVIADRDGNLVSMTTTINLNFGSRIAVDGFVLNNVITNFSAPLAGGGKTANGLQPRKRPVSSMAPVIVFDADGRPLAAGGSAGGGPIVDYIATALIDILANDRTPAQALARGHLSTAIRPKITLESATEADKLAAPLRALGHEVSIAPLRSGLGFIARRGSGWIGAADPRRDGNVGILPIR